MPLSYSVHRRGGESGFPAPSVPSLPSLGGQRSLALGAVSNAINGPCELFLSPDEDCWLAMSTAPDVTGGDTAQAAIRLRANNPAWYALPPGAHYIKAAA